MKKQIQTLPIIDKTPIEDESIPGISMDAMPIHFGLLHSEFTFCGIPKREIGKFDEVDRDEGLDTDQKERACPICLAEAERRGY